MTTNYRIIDSETTEVLGQGDVQVDGLIVRESLDAGPEGHVYAELRDNGRWTYVAPQHLGAVRSAHGEDAAKYVRRVYVEAV